MKPTKPSTFRAHVARKHRHHFSAALPAEASSDGSMNSIGANDGFSGAVDTWPGIQPHKEKRAPVAHSVSGHSVQHAEGAGVGCEPLAANRAYEPIGPQQNSRYTRGNPRLLLDLQNRLAATMAASASTPAADRIEVYRECWDQLADQLTLYKPLLKAIQAEYERFLAYYQQETENLMPKVLQVQALEEKKLKVHGEARHHCARAKVLLRKEMKKAEIQKVESETSLVTAREELVSRELELTRAQSELEGMHGINVSLCDAINNFEEQVNTQVALEEQEGQMVGEYKARLEEVLRVYQDVVETHSSANHKLNDVDDELRRKQAEARGLANKCKVLELELGHQEDEYTSAKEEYRDLRRKYGQMQRLLNGNDVRPPTPRPKWNDLPDFQKIIRGHNVNVNQPTAMIIDDLTELIENLRTEVEKARGDLPWVQAEKKAKAAMAGKWFVCRGTAPSVPKFLRMQGKVRNRNMNKRDCEATLNEFWEAKIAHDNKPKSQKMTVPDFLHKFLKSKFGLESAVVEYGYNLIDALKRFEYDADCELFLSIVNGELCEEAYYDQVDMINKFQKNCELLDKAKYGTKSMKKCLKREDFFQLLDDNFPFKAKDDKRSLELAVEYDQPLPMIYYNKLFEETRDGDQGKFAETLRDQHVYEVMTVYPSIEESIQAAHYENKPLPKVSDAELVTTLAVAKRGLLQHDSALPEADILRILATGLGLTRKDAPFSEFRKFKLTEFVQRLRGIVIHRYSEPPEGTEEERAFKAMRSLPIEERKLLEQMFAEIDTDFSGTLTNEEVALLMERVYGAHLPEDELERLYNAFDDSNDGVVTLDEFIKAIVTVPELKFVGDMFKWKLSFGRFDADHSGFVDNQELMEMVREIYGDASEQDVQSLMAQFDDGEDGDGQVSWPEFLQVMKATHS